MKNWFRKIISKLVKWLKPKYKTEHRDHLPEVIANETIYIIGESGNQWLIAFKCPCGCDSIIHLNLLEDAEPRWNYKITSKKRINIFPSIWRIKGCKSHFIVRNSKIDWVSRYKKRAER